MPSLVPLSALNDAFPSIQANIGERVNLLRFANLAHTLLTSHGLRLVALHLVSAAAP
jgi:hypothetical protein